MLGRAGVALDRRDPQVIARTGRRRRPRASRRRRRGRGSRRAGRTAPRSIASCTARVRVSAAARCTCQKPRVEPELALADRLHDGLRLRWLRLLTSSALVAHCSRAADRPGWSAPRGCRSTVPSRRSRSGRGTSRPSGATAASSGVASGSSCTGITRCERAAYGPSVPSSATCRRTRVRHPVPSAAPGRASTATSVSIAGHALQRLGEHLALQLALVARLDVAELGAARAISGVAVDGCRGPDVRLAELGWARARATVSARQNDGLESSVMRASTARRESRR